MPVSYIKKILQARVYEIAKETPLTQAQRLSKRYNNCIWIKREDLQPVFSFKLRGAYNKIAQLPQDQKECGVVTASAGNHAQGVAMAAHQLGVKATIVMPKTTPFIKTDAVERWGSNTLLVGDNFDAAYQHSLEIVEQQKLVYIHPYDDSAVIAGQGTIAMELLRQHKGPLDAVFIPVGGGGLIAGMATYIKYFDPKIKIFGVEPEDSACLAAALKAGHRVKLPEVGIFADGVAVARIGKEPFRLAKHVVDDVITVTTDEICAAIKDIFEDTRVISEPAGALAIAGMKKWIDQTEQQEQHLVAILSGANMNFDRLRHISERTEIGEQREAILAVTIPERKGSFLEFCRALGQCNVTEFNYRCNQQSREARVFVGLQVNPNGINAEQLQAQLQEKNYHVVNLSDNEMAKIHVRHLVGGRVKIPDEVLYRFEFPERPGALLDFLIRLGKRWNISLFHYRNHGAAYGRVLVGLQVPVEEQQDFDYCLQQINYRYWNETKNPANTLFLT